jgi:hypothetical protein
LALNRLPGKTPAAAHLYQFGLAPEDEVDQVAQQAWLDGRTRAYVVAATGEWWERVVQTFRTQWENLGGTVFQVTAEGEPKEQVAVLLHARSDSPPPQVTGTANPDFVFLAVPPALAQRFFPALHEVGLPVYATFHVLAGTEQDAVLTGLRVVVLPWTVTTDPLAVRLHTELERLWPTDFTTYQRLYALGVDAFRLLGELPRLAAEPQARIQGTTGSLSLDAERRVVRQGVWARVEGGKLIPASGVW